MTLRIRSELLAIEPLDPVEEAHRADALAWVASGAPIFRVARPATPPKHLVAYFVVVDAGHVLLVDHRNAQLWLPTGGHVECDEDPRVTVVRELEEELGLTIDLKSVGPPVMVTVTETVGLTSGHTDVTLWYVVPGDRSAALAFDRDEFEDVRWFAFAEAPTERCDPHLGRFMAKLARSPCVG